MPNLPAMSRRTKIILGIIATFGLINLGYQGWAFSHQTELLRRAEPHFFLLALMSQVLVYVALLPAFQAYFNATNIRLSSTHCLRLIVAGIGLGKVIPLGEYVVWRRKLRHHPDGVKHVTRWMIIYYALTFGLLGLLFVSSQILVYLVHSQTFAKTLAGKFVLVPAILTGIALLASGLLNVPPVRRRIQSLFERHLGTRLVAPWTVWGQLQYTAADVGILFAAFVLNIAIEAVTLYLCLRAIGLDIPMLVALFGYCFMRFFSLVPITPGGVGEVEAGTTLFFAAYGYAVSPVLTATVIFRLLTFWLPIAVGAIGYVRLGHAHPVHQTKKPPLGSLSK